MDLTGTQQSRLSDVTKKTRSLSTKVKSCSREPAVVCTGILCCVFLGLLVAVMLKFF